MPTPIFVVGCPRTGTTWVANILCRHDNISGIQAERHSGIHESAFFWKLHKRFGDIKNEKNYEKLVEFFTISDYFKISGLDDDIFEEKIDPSSYPDFFKQFMDIYAKTNDTDYWVEKTPAHTFYLRELIQFYPDAKFIALDRNLTDKIKSRIKELEWKSLLKNKQTRILKEILSYKLCNSFITKYDNRSNRVLLIKFEDLIKNEEDTIKKICNFIGIPFDKKLLEQAYPKNTYFSSEEERSKKLTKGEKEISNTLYEISNFLPDSLYLHLGEIYKFVSRYSEPPRWYEKE